MQAGERISEYPLTNSPKDRIMLGKLTDSEIDSLLMSEDVGRIGCHIDGKTLVVPITYAYDGARILCHSKVGEKIEAMRRNPSVCFEVDHIRGLRNWQSILIQGRYRELTGNDASIAIAFLTDQLKAKGPSETLHFEPERKTLMPLPAGAENGFVVYCIEIESKSGRFETPAARVHV